MARCSLFLISASKLAFAFAFAITATASASHAGLLSGIGFSAPNVNDKANVGNPQEGDIVLDVSDGGFYGYSNSGPGWIPLSPSTTTTPVPTVQRFTAGSGTYTTPAGVSYIRVRIVGGGGGGAGGGVGTNGGTGGTTTFGTSLLSASGGIGGTSGGSGGLGGAASSGSITSGFALTGGCGDPMGSTSPNGASGSGGTSPFGGAGGGVAGFTQTGRGGVTNSGSGGGGGTGASGYFSGGGGGAGGYVDVIIASPNATYSYSVGTAGAVGTGSFGANGGAGAAGSIVVEEFYN